jgi:hypothetical protein
MMSGKHKTPNYIFALWMLGVITIIAAGAFTDPKLGLFLVGIMSLISVLVFWGDY